MFNLITNSFFFFFNGERLFFFFCFVGSASLWFWKRLLLLVKIHKFQKYRIFYRYGEKKKDRRIAKCSHIGKFMWRAARFYFLLRLTCGTHEKAKNWLKLAKNESRKLSWIWINLHLFEILFNMMKLGFWFLISWKFKFDLRLTLIDASHFKILWINPNHQIKACFNYISSWQFSISISYINKIIKMFFNSISNQKQFTKVITINE